MTTDPSTLQPTDTLIGIAFKEPKHPFTGNLDGLNRWLARQIEAHYPADDPVANVIMTTGTIVDALIQLDLDGHAAVYAFRNGGLINVLDPGVGIPTARMLRPFTVRLNVWATSHDDAFIRLTANRKRQAISITDTTGTREYEYGTDALLAPAPAARVDYTWPPEPGTGREQTTQTVWEAIPDGLAPAPAPTETVAIDEAAWDAPDTEPVTDAAAEVAERIGGPDNETITIKIEGLATGDIREVGHRDTAQKWTGKVEGVMTSDGRESETDETPEPVQAIDGTDEASTITTSSGYVSRKKRWGL